MSLLSMLLAKERFREGFPVLPGALPFIGHLPALLFDAVDVLRRGHEQLGPVFWVRFGPSMELLFLGGAESFEVLKNKSATIQSAFRGIDRLVGGSAITQDGPEHLRIRSALNPTFSMRGLLNTGTGAVMAKTIADRIDRWAGLGEVSVLRETQELALDIILRIAGVSNDELPIWRHQSRELALLLVPIQVDLPGSPRRRGNRAADFMDAALAEVVQRIKKEPLGSGLTHSLLAARDEQGRALSDRELVATLRILIFAGHETTASVLAWLTFTLAQRPELWQRLLDETSRPEGAAIPVSIAEAKSFPFGEALFREALRRYAPAWFTMRRLIGDIDFAGHRIAAGHTLLLSLGGVLQDPARYCNPDAFDPDRWLGRASPPTPIEMAGFGAGAHFCLGYHLAWLEVQQFLVALGQKMRATGLRPRMADGPAPRELFFPLRHPFGTSRVLFTK